MGEFNRPIKESLEDLVNVKDFGAKGDGSYAIAPFDDSNPFRAIPGPTDDTDAFIAAITKCKAEGKGGIFVPDGIYKINKSLPINDLNLHGNGYKTVLVASGEAWTAETPLLYVGGFSQVSNLSLQYDFAISAISNPQPSERGKYCLIKTYCVNDRQEIRPLQRSSSIRNLRTSFCWTAISDEPTDLFTGNTSADYGALVAATPFSITFDTLEISNFAYSGIDFVTPLRTGNVYSNIYIANGFLEISTPEWQPTPPFLYQPQTGFSLAGEESESIINQLNVEHTTFSDAAIKFENCLGLSVGTIHIEGVDNATAGGAYVKWNNSAGVIDALVYYNTRMSQDNTSLIEFGGSLFYKDQYYYNPNTANRCQINNLVLLNIAQPYCRGRSSNEQPLYPYYANSNYGWAKPSHSIRNFFSRSPSFTNAQKMYVNVKQYTWNAIQFPAPTLTVNSVDENTQYLSKRINQNKNLIVSWK